MRDHLRRWLRWIWRSEARDRQIELELSSHLELEAEEQIEGGMSPEEARSAARRALGNVGLIKEDTRAVWVWSFAEKVRQDLGYAWRLMRRSPAFAAAVTLTLGLGIGANTAIFTLVDAVLLQSLPVADPERLVIIDRIGPRGEQINQSYPLFERLRGAKRVFSGVLAVQDGFSRLDVAGSFPRAAHGAGRTHAQSHEARVQLASGDYFGVLGVSPFAGRLLTRHDERAPGAHPVAVLSHAFWKRRFGGDIGVIGHGITLDNSPFTVVGVAPPGFFGESVGRAPDVWVPLMMQGVLDRGRSLLGDASVGWLRVMARLRTNVTPRQAEAALAILLDRLHAQAGDAGKRFRHTGGLRVADGRQGLERFREQFALPLRILAAVVGVVLLIACANVSSLLLARATARQREVAIRAAIGAGRGRLMRQFLTESVLLAALGGGLGLLIAWWGGRILLVLASSDGTPIPIDVAPNTRTLAFTTVVSLVTVIAFGLVPALFGSRVEVGTSLKLSGVGRPRASLSPLLVVVQVALSLLLLTGAALFVQTLRNLRTIDFGFAADAMLQIRVDPGASGHDAQHRSQLSRRLVEHLRSVPGVRSASVASSGFDTGISRTCCIAIEGYAHEPSEDREIQTISVEPGYFQTMRLPLLVGRDFVPQHATDFPRQPPRVAIVNQAFARRFYADVSPVGKRFGWGNPPQVSYDIEIIGVARNANYGDLREEAKPMIYFPTSNGDTILVCAAGATQALAATIRREVQTVDGNLQVLGISAVSEHVERALVREKLLARLSSFFGTLATVLAAIGLYGLMAYRVVGRTREIGIRMAIGAQRGAVLRGEMRSALLIVSIGIFVGAPATFAVGRLITSQLFGVSATDPNMLAVATTLLVLVASVAAYLPARRAARVDPMAALRDE